MQKYTNVDKLRAVVDQPTKFNFTEDSLQKHCITQTRKAEWNIAYSVFICNQRINVYGDLVLNPLETIHVPYFHFNISRVVSINLLIEFIESKKSLTRNWYRSSYRVCVCVCV